MLSNPLEKTVGRCYNTYHSVMGLPGPAHDGGCTSMSGIQVRRLMIAAPAHVADKLAGILAGAQIQAQTICHSGEEAVAAAGEDGVLLLTTWRLADMSGEELARRMGERSDVLMIVPQEFDAPVQENVLPLCNPISQDALVQTIRAMAYCRGRMEELRERAQRLARTLEERKVIERAKGRLMDQLHLSEAEAHYRMQKKSMDSGRRIIDVAQEILDAQEIIAS